ncbi:hypothetical protein U0035_17025 [Niabella yanshanensis]|uniref:Uncharacterized protein n=1 Tax=Niabella yanshanensis TaxID=577386 RepID=A0ABZ0W273_9BACT|nr:hypothetical protein [Niabella yanshanensis]WQD37373.1 hypothetical protein U0035_17025 [Niabella yanshanensis]
MAGNEKQYITEEEDDLSSVVNEPEDSGFEKAENDLLRAALKRTYKERFLVMTTLMKRSVMFKNAKITY